MGESVHTSASFWAGPFKQQTKRLQRLDMQPLVLHGGLQEEGDCYVTRQQQEVWKTTARQREEILKSRASMDVFEQSRKTDRECS